MICSGEALPLPLQERFFELLPGPELHNLYGPTEAAVDVTYWECDTPYRTRDPLVPIGRPVANTQMYVLDRWGQPTPLGVPGELHIGGVQVGGGYLNRAELTAEKFVPDPFSRESEAEALYNRTGDSARWLPEGVIECLGRLDFQVKIRGFRIELGEIEAVLLKHPDVREAVVDRSRRYVPRRQAFGGLFDRSRPDTAPSGADLRDYLRQKLPDYMVPSSFVLLESAFRCRRKGISIPNRCPRRTARGKACRGVTWRRGRPWKNNWRPSGRRCSRSNAWASRTTSSISAGIRCWGGVTNPRELGVRDDRAVAHDLSKAHGGRVGGLDRRGKTGEEQVAGPGLCHCSRCRAWPRSICRCRSIRKPLWFLEHVSRSRQGNLLDHARAARRCAATWTLSCSNELKETLAPSRVKRAHISPSSMAGPCKMIVLPQAVKIPDHRS